MTHSILALLCLVFQDTPALSADQQKLNQQSFNIVWETIRDKHFDPKLGGLDWQKVRTEFEPKAKNAKNMTEFRRHVNDMIGRLGQSHFSIIPSQAYKAITPDVGKDQKETGAGGRDGPGFEVRVVAGEALVTKIDPLSPSAKMGVRAGWQILKIEDADVAPILAKLKDGKRPEVDQSVAVLGRLRGRAGQKKTVLFRDGQQKELALEVPIINPKGTPAKLGHLPTIHVTHESRTIDKSIGYFQLTAFFDPASVMTSLERCVKQHHKADGFIIDLRGNPGGIGAMALGFGGWFIDKPDQKLGTMTTREGELKFVLNPRTDPFLGPLAILVDSMSGSTSEILAGGLQDLKRARVFGSTTMGAALPSHIIRLPNGDGFQYAFGNYVSFGGKPLEGIGVRPDVEVSLTREALLQGRDPILDSAVEWIRRQSKSK